MSLTSSVPPAQVAMIFHKEITDITCEEDRVKSFMFQIKEVGY